MVRLTVSTLLCSSVGWSACSLDVRLLHAVTRLFVFQSRSWIRSAVGLIRVSSYSRRAVGTSLGSSHGRDVFDSSGGRSIRWLVRRTFGTLLVLLD